MRHGTRVVAMFGVVALSVAVCAGSAMGQSATTTTSGASKGASTTGVTKDTIKISVSGPYSGVYGVIGKQTYGALQLWEEEVNSTGGINGRKVQLVQVDNQFTPEGAVAACKEVQSNDTFIDFNQIDSGDQIGCEDKAGVPVFATNSGLGAKAIKAYKYTTIGRAAPVYPAPEVSFLGSKYMNAKGKKIGIVMGQGPSFAAWYTGLRAQLKKSGYNVVHVERTAPDGTQTSFVSEMQRMQQSGAEVVLLETVLEGPGIIRDATALGYKPQYYLGPLGTQDILAQTQNDQYNGMIGTRFETTTETPAYAAWVEKVRKYQGDAAAKVTNPTNASAYGLAAVLGQVLKAAGPDLTRESFVTAARSMADFDEQNLVGPYTTKGMTLPIGLRALFPVKCCNPDKTFKSLGPPAETFPAAKTSTKK